jgi:hypothetical protein
MTAARKLKRSKEHEPTVMDILQLGKDMMNRSKKQMGEMASEDRRFREVFGIAPAVALEAWSMICSAGLLPGGGTLQHWLWTLCFLKVYALQVPLCALCGGSDPKTVSKWVWLFIRTFIILEGDVVSKFSCVL